MTKMLNGKVVSSTLLSKDTYDAMNRVIVKATKKETPQTEQPTTTTPNPNTTNNQSNGTTGKPLVSPNKKTPNSNMNQNKENSKPKEKVKN